MPPDRHPQIELIKALHYLQGGIEPCRPPENDDNAEDSRNGAQGRASHTPVLLPLPPVVPRRARFRNTVMKLGPGLIAANRSTTATMSSGGSNNSTDVMADLRLCAPASLCRYGAALITAMIRRPRRRLFSCALDMWHEPSARFAVPPRQEKLRSLCERWRRRSAGLDAASHPVSSEL